MKIPNFFLVGAPKSGTTAMTEYLRMHNDIFMPERKELHYFGKDLRFIKGGIKEESQYLSFFQEARDQERIGEASVWYLYSRLAASEIRAFSHESDIIIMLRNPVDMIYSLHSQFIKIGNEDIESFEDALNAEQERKKGLKIPKKAHFIEGLYYSEIAKYTAQVRRYIDVFSREKVFIIIFDDFISETEKVYKETLEFLGVDSEFYPKLNKINANSRFRNVLIHDLLQNPPKIIRWFAKSVIPIKKTRKKLWKIVMTKNEKQIQRPEMSFELREELKKYFEKEIEDLSLLLKRDLTFWTSG